ncbi:hypothetical protein MX850_00590 [Erysipelothrix sp. Poltava]|nr:hypothetical protein MX850_00590 [Erysipelothrix sp. Poltava]
MSSLADFDGDLHVMKQDVGDSGDSGGYGGGASAPSIGGGGAVDLSGLEFDWDEQADSIDKVNEKVEQLLGFVKGIGVFVEKHKVPVVSTLAAVSAGLGTLGLIALYGKFQKVAEVGF